ncbi:MAG TPA: 16S rRNA (cytosine(967)-C(5))-methyltransferase RsmB, partial [Solirubrobacteraceae bacterium]
MSASRTHEIAPARRCAYRVIMRVFDSDAFADRAFRLQAKTLESRDRQLAMRLAYGTVQRKATLDHLIVLLAERPTERLEGPILAALRMGLYELLYLDGSPDYAVLADAVELAKSQRAHAGGLVNAVLRRATREARELLAGLDDLSAERAAIMHSHPRWLARMWWEALGAEQARALMAANNEPAEVALRVNTLRGQIDDLAASLPCPTHRDPDIPEALVLERALDLEASPQWRSGALLAQSRAAMLVAHILEPQPGERILDLCAAPGGKSSHIAALMQATGEIVAVERSHSRATQMTETLQRLGASNVRVEHSDAARPRSDGPFDRVLVDAPCSGLGTLQSNPDLRWRASEKRIGEMTEAQSAILKAAGAAVRPGGVLVYCTCT